LTGLDDERDWPRSLWVTRSAEADAPAREAPIFLRGLRRLTATQGAVLASLEGGRLFLPDLEALDLAAARSLAAGHHELFLDGLSALELPVAEVLARSRRPLLSLRGLKALAPDLASVLAEFDGALLLDGVESLDVPTARALSMWDAVGEAVILSLGNLGEPDVPVIEALARTRGWGLSLGIRRLSPEAADALADLAAPSLALDHLDEIAPETARRMALWQRKFLSLDGLATLDPSIRELLERGSAAISLRGVHRGR
jgi:hypothetical protein